MWISKFFYSDETQTLVESYLSQFHVGKAVLAEYMQADILALKSFVSQTSKKKSFNADKLFSH